MTDWQDPKTVSNERRAALQLEHVLGGLCIWELITNLGFDFRLLMYGSAPTVSRGGWVKWIYLAARMLLLATFVNIFVGVDVGRTVDCTVQMKLNVIIPSTASQMATALMAIRTIAIWDRNIYICVLAALCMTGQLISIVHSCGTHHLFDLAQLNGFSAAVYIKAHWVHATKTCNIDGYEHSLAISVALLFIDLFLVLLMLVGLLRLRSASTRQSLWHLLWKQGWLWLTLTPLAGVPPAVFLFLDLNRYMDLMFLAPQMIISVIGATRMYRGLFEFSRPVEVDLTPNHEDPEIPPVNLSTVVAFGTVSGPSRQEEFDNADGHSARLQPGYRLRELSRPRSTISSPVFCEPLEDT